MEFWKIVSGRPSGEVHHWEVYIAFSEYKAGECLDVLERRYERKKDWLHGPHIFSMDGNPKEVLCWSGFELVPAGTWD